MPERSRAARALEAMDRLHGVAILLEHAGHTELANALQLAAAEIGPANTPERAAAVDLLVPEPRVLPGPAGHQADSGMPYWVADGAEVVAWPEGVEICGSLHEDVREVEATTLALLAAVRSHHALAAATVPPPAAG